MTLSSEIGGGAGGIQVIYDDTVLREEAPYQVSIDEQRATLLLLNHGVTQEKVSQARLLIRESPPEQTLSPIEGYFTPGNLTLVMYPNVIFENSGGKPGNRPNHVFLHESKHLINHLTRPDYERRTGRMFKRMNGIALVAGTASVLIALGLALPDMFGVRNDEKVAQMTQQLATFGAMYIPATMAFYHLSPIELSAQRFAGRLNRNSQWQSIVTISPKSK